MKKLSAVIVLVALVGGLVFYVGSNLDGIVKDLIEEHGSAATQTPVNVDGVSINLSEASAAISRLSVGNPEGFAGNAIEMEQFALTLDAASLTSDVIVIENILVKGAKLNIMQQANGNNLQQLLRNLDDLASDDSGEDSDDGKKIIINRFTLEGASASLSAPDFEENREVTLPAITLRNIGTASGGATGTEVAQQVLKPILNEALKSAAVQAIRDKATDAIEDVADKLLEGIFGEDKEPEE
ncbi:MAG: hypothetical protein OEM63_11975 [Gammaproteobacteria bacterium]|nr:hypothetical protein [Gammaproteobacteria bacterium]